MNTFQAQFYIGLVILSLEYLHSKSIIHRDLKPENIMVEADGYIKVIDFGTAKLLTDEPFRTYTLLGTPSYMAPETIKGHGYTYSADFWAVGVMLYEFLAAKHPYGESTTDPMQIYEEITTKELSFPSNVTDRIAKRLLVQLLSKSPESRIGGTIESLKANAWFKSFEWSSLALKEIEAPYKPKKELILSPESLEKLESRKVKISEQIKVDIERNLDF